MLIPNKIKIGNFDYTVIQTNFIELFNNKVVGQIDYLNKKIQIKKNIKDIKHKEDIFFHEVAHGLIKEMEFNFPKISYFRNNEKFIQELGLHLRKIFLDLSEKQKI